MFKRDENLTDDERKALCGSDMPMEVRDVLASIPAGDTSVRLAALRKFTALVQAECDALEAARDLRVLRDEHADVAALRERVQHLETRNATLDRVLDQKDAQIEHLTAVPALVEHSEGTGR